MSPIPSILGPVIVLNGWTLVVETWMYSVLIPAFRKMGNLTNTMTKGQTDLHLPAPVRWKRDNYNHLFEQPTQFYAVALTLAVARGSENRTDLVLAWAYVGARIAHTLVHCTRNHLMTRFSLFATSSGLLAIMTARAAKLVFGF
ncbi:hypothetical protein N7492_010051 [Penicillium capsulatum]|uniref:MAPEG family protein n=1 Tax=Penicillium capsulatum TaxID=69766 RepID=A0A9W9HNU3_9EURO|nr:hypothetical protein N7492_010051 [Penicillium capsulatum]KAJ6112560.1 hypothetical protein N7512_007884 [Penicillium capsulatum]